VDTAADIIIAPFVARGGTLQVNPVLEIWGAAPHADVASVRPRAPPDAGGHDVDEMRRRVVLALDPRSEDDEQTNRRV